MHSSDTSIVEHAIEFAALVHAGQLRKGSSIPYIVHPVEVAAICSRMTSDRQIIAAGALHDVVEDTPTDIEEIEYWFGDRVAEIVAGVSEDKRRGVDASATWYVRKQESIARLAETRDLSVLVVCLADKLSNMRTGREEIARVGERYWERFNMRDVNQHAWYYRSIVDILKPALGKTHEWRELRDIVDEMFGDV